MKIARLVLLATTCLLPAVAQHSGDPEFAAPAPRTCALRESFIAWHCYAPKPHVGPDSFPVPTQGRNCRKSEAKAATGICYKDSFGDWHTMLCCEGHAISETKWMVSNFPPPPANR